MKIFVLSVYISSLGVLSQHCRFPTRPDIGMQILWHHFSPLKYSDPDCNACSAEIGSHQLRQAPSKDWKKSERLPPEIKHKASLPSKSRQLSTLIDTTRVMEAMVFALHANSFAFQLLTPQIGPQLNRPRTYTVLCLFPVGLRLRLRRQNHPSHWCKHIGRINKL